LCLTGKVKLPVSSQTAEEVALRRRAKKAAKEGGASEQTGGHSMPEGPEDPMLVAMMEDFGEFAAGGEYAPAQPGSAAGTAAAQQSGASRVQQSEPTEQAADGAVSAAASSPAGSSQQQQQQQQSQPSVGVSGISAAAVHSAAQPQYVAQLPPPASLPAQSPPVQQADGTAATGQAQAPWRRQQRVSVHEVACAARGPVQLHRFHQHQRRERMMSSLAGSPGMGESVSLTS